jgi:hypothetical protein
MGIFERHRHRVEGAAAQKYERGEVESDGTVLVRTGDLTSKRV